VSYVHLTLQERYVIHHLVLYRLSIREIARRLQRSPSTISRELKRNARHHSCYWHEPAHRWAIERRQHPKHFRRQCNKRLSGYIKTRLQRGWSPELISGRLTQDYPDNPDMRFSTEGIYRWLYRDAKTGGTLYRHLVRCHAKRRQQRKYGSLRGLIPNRVSIHERPGIVNRRQRFGDWESDTMEGAKGKGGLATHLERKSRYLVAARLQDKKASTFTQGSLKAFRRIPHTLRLTLTADNGKEFARFKEFEGTEGFTVYFADPYSAWQRGANENTNGLLRRSFPKGTNFHEVTNKEVAVAVKKLNNRPRKCLNYRTPQEVFSKALRVAVGS